jgi:hypothetical protein
MSWADTSAGVMKMRNGANSAWISLYELDGTFLASDISLAAGSAAAPSLFFTGDTNTGIYSPGADQIGIATGGTSRIVVDASGNVNIDSGVLYVDAANNRVGIGTTGPTSKISVVGGTTQAADFSITGNNNASGTGIVASFVAGGAGDPGTTKGAYISMAGSSVGDVLLGIDNSYPGIIRIKTNYTTPRDLLTIDPIGPIVFLPAGTERARIDSSGRLLVGTSSSLLNNDTIQIAADNTNCLGLLSGRADAFGPRVDFAKARGTTTSPGNVTNGDQLANLSFQGYHGSYVEGAKIEAYVDGTPGASDMPGRLVFSTTADGASSPTERMRITNGGDVYVGKTQGTQNFEGIQLSKSGTGIFAVASDVSLYVNRFTTDGSLVVFSQDSTQEGSISVSGTTVSYNGAHLSRWSQLPGGATREEILRGTVLSNIDEMCGWGEEENEQLNRMKVSDVEGDKNVSGVFQAWDDDDDTYTDDFYCAMTGDFIIRIAEGVTVERGDLLMSAGDGTAKPQDDDIIRSKTVAKVTSTHVTCTYEDGSYCVPCVLMAC